MVSYGGGDGEGLCFRGNMGRLLQWLHHTGFRAPFEKWFPDRLLYATSFKRVWDNIWIKQRHLKGTNKWESSRKLDSNGPGIYAMDAPESTSEG